jgi:DNA-binding CsgD family transcriptional regulator
MICPRCGRNSEHITALDMKILQFMRSGMGNAEIASVLGFSLITTNQYIQRVYRIVGAQNRREFVAAFKTERP